MSIFEIFKKKSSGDVAKDRLKLLLVSDRANCSPEVMELIKNDIINVIKKYMEIDCEGLDIQITQTESDNSNGTVPALIANIPIKEVKHNADKQQ
jgi:cell division topological specificity factor